MVCMHLAPFHCEDIALPSEPNIMSLWQGEVYLLRGVGHVRDGEEYYDNVGCKNLMMGLIVVR
jgi:hypothetical protein